jgi:glycerol-3-phosphate dehydrogenase
MEAPVLILGAGINGAALARELALSGVPVVVVDTADLACGATAYSSRLIHGGLRYLEYGEFDLVRESLAERTRLLRLAPQFVRPLRLFIPVAGRFGGLGPTLRRFIGWETKSDRRRNQPRGLWLVRMGLRMYDAYARDPELPRYEVHALGAPSAPAVDSRAYRWLCAYWDAQIRFPERFVVALFEDTRRAAAERGSTFELWTYHQAKVEGAHVSIVNPGGETIKTFTPSAVINATGAWVDYALQLLAVPSRRMMGGTKGSHFFTHNDRLRMALGGEAIYAEASDGRPVFVLPFGDGVLIGTTDERFEGNPRDAVASPHELRYLVDTVNALIPTAQLTDSDVAFHYRGVRPLPAVESGRTAAITRRHWLEEHAGAPWPLYSIIGGKLTTCRSLAEGAAATLLKKLNRTLKKTSADRVLPGAEDFPRDDAARQALLKRWEQESGLAEEQIAAIWPLVGMELATYLKSDGSDDRESIAGTSLPRGFVRWVIAREWVTRLEDLVERRLLLMYEPRLSMTTLQELAELLAESRIIDQPLQLAATIARLQGFYGLRLNT